MAESKFDGLDDAGVVARVDQAVPEAAEEGGLVPPLPECVPTLGEESSGCDVSDPPTEGKVVTVSALPSRPTPRRLIGTRRGSSPNSSGGSGVPCKKLATAADAVPYNHAIGKSLELGAVCPEFASWLSPSRGFFRAAGPDGSTTGSPTRALPLLMDRAVSRRLVYPSPSRCGGSMSISCILDRSMTTSPLIAQPPVP